ncbi:MAG: recJ [Candidatus Paceibacter sp.]|jgi:single-stranded-DNA-specific exonuclease|nr:recJ [Candidatus Paceibacter sp.]
MKEYAVRNPIPSSASEALKAYPELQRALLIYRGVDTPEKAEKFLNPNYETDLHDPFLMKDMDKAVERILKAIEQEERILIYSDYDADGIPAAVVMADFFKLINYKNFEIYIPHRHNEGYGLHLEALDTFPEKGIKLLVTLDCGIVDHAEVAHAKKLGIDVIVTDHHLPGETLPDAFAVVNPKRNDCEYPYKMKCGAGVAFKLVQALLKKGNFESKDGAEKWLLDMVGIATLSDMVPLQGENRVLAYYGLKVLRKSRRPGFVKLLKMMKVDQRYITEDDVGFMITPRINAASRMGVPTDAFKLLSTTDEAEGDALAKHLDAINNERKGLVASTVKEIKKILAEREEHFATRKVIVMGNPSWRPALLGLAANTIAEEFNKPVFLWGREEGKEIKGSCRSDGVTHLVKLMNEVKDHFHEYGGHAFSGGFAIQSEKIHTFEDALHDASVKLGNEAALQEPQPIDAKLLLDDVTWSLQRQIDQLAPFGMDNPKPLFMFENISPAEVKLFGKTKDHLELTFYNSQNKKIRAIGFFMTPEDFTPQPKKGIPLTLIASIEKSYFGASPELRLRIVDIL